MLISPLVWSEEAADAALSGWTYSEVSGVDWVDSEADEGNKVAGRK